MKFYDQIGLLGRLHHCKGREERAIRIIKEAIGNGGKWYVSFSGGKDSTVLLDLVRRVVPDIDVVWFDDGWDYPETLEFLQEMEKKVGKIWRVSIPVHSSFWRKEVEYGGDDPFYSHECDYSWEELMNNYDGAFIGMRKEESGIRNFVLRRRGALYYSDKDKQWHCCPLADWTYQEIWGYIAAHELEFNSVYSKLFDLGMEFEKLRVGPLTAWIVYQYGIIVYLKRGWMDLFNRMMAVFPELRKYS